MTDTENNPSYQASKRRFRWFVRLAVFIVLVTITLYTAWYCSPRFRVRVYLGLYLISPAKVRVWALEEIEETENTIDGRITKDLVVEAKLLALDDSNAEIRAQALFDLSHMGRLPEISIEAITALLDNPKLCEDAARFLGNQGSRAREAVPKLIPLLSSQDPYLRTTVIRSLGEIGSDSAAAVPHLLLLLEDPQLDWQEKEEIAAAVGQIGPGAAKAVPDIIRLLTVTRKRDLDFFGKQYVLSLIAALGHIGPSARSAVPTLIAILKESQDWQVRETIVSLGGIGEAAAPAIPLIAPKLRNPDYCEDGFEALTKIGPAALPVLKKIKASTKTSLSKQAATAVERIELKKRRQS